MNIKKFLIGTSIGALMLGASVIPGFAAPDGVTLNWGTEVNSGECPAGKLVVNVTHKVVNDVDSRVGGGVWARDDYNRLIKVWEVDEDTFCATVKYKGQFETFEGGSPEGTDTIAAGIKGTMEGGYRSTIFIGTLDSTPSHPTKGNLGTFNYGCLSTDPGDHSSCTDLFNWVGTYFTSPSGFDLDWWGWIYHGGNNGTWVNKVDGNLGDITD